MVRCSAFSDQVELHSPKMKQCIVTESDFESTLAGQLVLVQRNRTECSGLQERAAALKLEKLQLEKALEKGIPGCWRRSCGTVKQQVSPTLTMAANSWTVLIALVPENKTRGVEKTKARAVRKRWWRIFG